ncbi:MAG: hypothetical protein ABJZ55_07705 [Fuerstiella sp.]
MTATRNQTKCTVPSNLFRLLMLTLIFIATPSIARADIQTKMGLDGVATSIGYLAAAIAFAGLAIAIAIYLAFRSRSTK